MTNSHSNFLRIIAISILCTLGFLTLGGSAANAAERRGVTLIRPDSPFTESLHELLAADWSKWAAKIPAGEGHPLFDETGEYCHVGQEGPVWYLGGTFTTFTNEDGVDIGVANRTCVIPWGKFIFAPIINVSYSNIGEVPQKTDQELVELTAFYGTGISEATLEIDGKVYEDMLDDLILTPQAFDLTYPEDNIFGTGEAGTTRAAVTGVHFLLSPPKPGKHKIHFTGRLEFTKDVHGFDYIFELDITYDILVLPE